MSDELRILGVDPGSRVTGYGVIEVNQGCIRYVASGCIRTEGGSHIKRLSVISTGMRQVLDQYGPQEAAIEKIFLSKNADSALKLGQARAAAICRLLDDLSADSIFEYGARAIKQATVGYGAADKAQVQHMVKRLLSLQGALSSDAADGLAVALCHATSRTTMSAIQRGAGSI